MKHTYLPTLGEVMDGNPEVTTLHEMYADDMTYGGFETVGGYFEDGGADEEMNPLDEPPVDDELDAPGTDNAFSTHPLFGDGTDALPFPFEHQIACAGAKELEQLAAEMHVRNAEG